MQWFRPDPKLDSPALVRFRGNRGGIIPMHRALTRLRFGPAQMLSSVGTAVSLIGAWIISLPVICSFWKQLFAVGLRLLPLECELKSGLHQFSFGLTLLLPYFAYEPEMPSSRLWAGTCIVVLAVFAATFVMPAKLIPITYLVRCVLFVQASSLVYFAVAPAQFPYAPADYLQGLLLSGATLIGIVPLLFLLTYYIFPFSLLKKASLTLLTMVYLALFLPLQVTLHALIIEKSILFMPVLYLVFGMPLDVLIIVSLYAWGMTWEFKGSRTDAKRS
jgi:hypothetical protein